MSSFHPLGPAATGSHPLTGQTGAAALPFHADDEDSWTPPSLPGEASALGSNNKARVKAGGSSSIRSPLDHAPVHPLGGSLSAGDTSTTLGNSSSNYSNGNGHSGGGGGGVGDDDNNLGRRAVGPADSSRVGRGFSGPTPAWGAGVGAGTRGGGASAVGGRQGGGGDRNDQEGGRRRVAAGGGRGAGRSMAAGGDVINGGGAGGGFGGESRTLSDIHTLRLHSYYVPTFCDACSQLLIGIMQQGLRCDVCGMNLHPECRATPCSLDHRCRPPETVHIPSGVDDSRLVGVRLKPGYPSRAMGGAAAAGPRAALGAGGGGGTALPLEDPLDSDWHKQLVHNNQLWVPDAVASDCMVCARPFNLVFRRHHCRRCGTCMCGSCSHTAVSDKILAVNQSTGGVVRLSSGQPVRCCTPCTRILDQQLVQALQRKGWGPKRPNAAAGADPASARSPAAPTHAGAAGGYAASLPASYASTESLDGGGFVPPPSSSSLSASHTFPASGGGGGGGDGIGNGYDGGRRGGDGYGASPASGGDDPLSRDNQQQQPGPPPPPQLPEPPASTGVPSWLGNSSLSTRRATGGGSVASRAPAGGQHPQEVEEEQEEEGVWGAAAVDPEESTDWSVAGAVV